MDTCTQSGHRPGTWEVLDSKVQCRKCTECGKIVVTADIPDIPALIAEVHATREALGKIVETTGIMEPNFRNLSILALAARLGSIALVARKALGEE